MVDDELLSEYLFEKTLLSERKSAECSGRPFYLALIRIGNDLIRTEQEREKLIHGISAALLNSLREIDLIGWYLENSVIGIICPRVRYSDADYLSRIFCGRVNAAVKDTGSGGHIFISSRCYPDPVSIRAALEFEDEKLLLDAAA
jgi:hypothetical protein